MPIKRQRSMSSPYSATTMAIHQRHIGDCTSRRWLVVIMMACLAYLPLHSEAFTISMEYRPPVKSSVSKLHDRRLPRASPSASSSTSTNGRSSSRQDAFAGAIAPERSSPSTSSTGSAFERRMRELALGAQNKILREKEVQRPANVHVVESLQDYKRVVGEEKDRVVVVRFHATWCRVRRNEFIELQILEYYALQIPVPNQISPFVVHTGLQSGRSLVLSPGICAQGCRLCRCPSYPT